MVQTKVRPGRTLILTLDESVAHPLVDSDHPGLSQRCADKKSLNRISDPQLKSSSEQACSELLNQGFFVPRDTTVIVHMWSHVHLGENY